VHDKDAFAEGRNQFVHSGARDAACRTFETIKQAIAIAAGVSILPRPAVAKEVGIRMLGAVPLAIGGLVRPVAIIHRKGKRLPPAVDRFIDVLRKAGDAQAPDGTPGQSGRGERS
jgi:DNA-binding transcriptional LysR family regulator